MRDVPLKVLVAALVSVLGAVTVMASGSLILLTTWLDRATVELGDAVESIRLAEGAVEVLLLVERAEDSVVRTDLEASLARNLRLARQYVATEEEGAALARAETAVAAWVGSDHTDEALYEEAFGALRDVAAINTEQARLVRREAARLNRAGDVIGTFCAVAVPAMLVVAFVAIDRRLRPVLDLGRAMEAFAAGDRDARAPEVGPAELREMARRFNQLAASLAQQQEAQLAFLAGVAHDLRNPISALRLASAAATRGAGDPQRMLEITARQIDHLDRMLSDLLDAARVHAGRLKLELRECDLRDVARDVVELYGVTGAAPIALDLPPEPVVARCDATRVGQVLANLVSNAIKYSPAGAEVRVAVRAQDHVGRVSVTDRGAGIADTEVGTLFAPFRRGRLEGPAVPGAGLGLFVSRRIVEEHGGRIAVDTAPGRGSTFTVEIPLGA